MNSFHLLKGVSTTVAALGLAVGLMSTPAEAHCAGKHVGDHPHCAPDGSITYRATLTGAFEFRRPDGSVAPVVVTPNNRENVLRSDKTRELSRPIVPGSEQDTWDQVFKDECPVLLGVQVDSFFAGRDDWSISTSDDESFDDVVMVLFHKVIPVHADGGSHAEVNVQFRSSPLGFVDPFLPVIGNTSTFELERGGINGSSVRGVNPRESCQPKGSGGFDIFDLLAGGELTLTITAD